MRTGGAAASFNGSMTKGGLASIAANLSKIGQQTFVRGLRLFARACRLPRTNAGSSGKGI
jgi:hypothetical protein